MSKARPTNREILEQFERHVQTNQITLVRLEQKLADIQDEVHEVKSNQLTSGKVMAWIAGSIASSIALIISLVEALK